VKILVTAGPTREPIDPVRFISNRSSGKMGYALARVAAGMGHEVRLVSGPVCLAAPENVRVFNVLTAEEMLAAVTANMKWCHVLIMAAAVCDWRPVKVSRTKIKKTGEVPSIAIEQTPDILTTVSARKGRRVIVGFAAETGDPIAEAARKLSAKKLDLIVANDVSRADAGFETDTNRVSLLDCAGVVRHLPLMSKDAVAGKIISWIEQTRSTV